MIEHHQPILLLGEFEHEGNFLYDSLMFSGTGAGIMRRDRAILDGKVCVNGEVVTDVGHKVKSNDLVCLNNHCYFVV